MVIFSGGYLYIFDNAKAASTSDYYYIKDAEIITDDPSCEVKFGFKLKRKDGSDIWFSARNQKDFDNWTNEIKVRIAEFMLSGFKAKQMVTTIDPIVKTDVEEQLSLEE